jgi:hypothetical protein
MYHILLSQLSPPGFGAFLLPPDDFYPTRVRRIFPLADYGLPHQGSVHFYPARRYITPPGFGAFSLLPDKLYPTRVRRIFLFTSYPLPHRGSVHFLSCYIVLIPTTVRRIFLLYLYRLSPPGFGAFFYYPAIMYRYSSMLILAYAIDDLCNNRRLAYPVLAAVTINDLRFHAFSPSNAIKPSRK